MKLSDIGKKIRSARQMKGLTQAQAGEKAGGLSRGTVSNIENGSRSSLHGNVEALAKAVGVKL